MPEPQDVQPEGANISGLSQPHRPSAAQELGQTCGASKKEVRWGTRDSALQAQLLCILETALKIESIN